MLLFIDFLPGGWKACAGWGADQWAHKPASAVRKANQQCPAYGATPRHITGI